MRQLPDRHYRRAPHMARAVLAGVLLGGVITGATVAAYPVAVLVRLLLVLHGLTK